MRVIPAWNLVFIATAMERVVVKIIQPTMAISRCLSSSTCMLYLLYIQCELCLANHSLSGCTDNVVNLDLQRYTYTLTVFEVFEASRFTVCCAASALSTDRARGQTLLEAHGGVKVFVGGLVFLSRGGDSSMRTIHVDRASCVPNPEHKLKT